MVTAMLALTVLLYFLLFIFDIKPLYKKKLWADFWVNVTLTGISFTVAVLLCLKVKIPSPELPIRELITSIFGK